MISDEKWQKLKFLLFFLSNRKRTEFTLSQSADDRENNRNKK